jgi:hypothetical protein
MVQLPRGKGGPQVTVYYWFKEFVKPGEYDVGHVSIQIGDMYLSHLPSPSPGKYLGSRDDIPNLPGKHPVIKKKPILYRTLKADSDKYSEMYGEPKVVRLPADQLNLFPMMQFMKDKICGIGAPSSLAPHKPLPFFDLSQATFTKISEVAPRNKTQFVYYQICDSKGSDGNLNGDRSNCATMVADCIGSGISMEKQNVYKEVTSQYAPRSLVSTINKVFNIQGVTEAPVSASGT